jgi:hypothetical protein
MSDESIEDFPTRAIPAGAILYHGTSSPEKFRRPSGPAFFSDSESVARYFATWREGGGGKKGRPRILRYEVVHEISHLALIESTMAFDDFSERVGYGGDPESTEERVDMVCSAGFDGWIIPNNYPDGADIMLCQPERWLVFIDESKVR